MKAKWYGDKRDIVKWGVMISLAQIHGIKNILQIPFCKEDPTEFNLEIDGNTCSMPASVTAHFPRWLKDIERLNSKQLKIQVLEVESTSRHEHLKILLSLIQRTRSAMQGSVIVFLDPDTGIGPADRVHRREHVSCSELAEIWNHMRVDDLLVFYQHRTNIFQEPHHDWVGPKQRQFESAIGLAAGEAKIARGSAADDVVFFFAKKRLSEHKPVYRPAPKFDKKTCPECGKQFRRQWVGIDGHWKSEHSERMPYELAWPLIKAGKYPRSGD